MKDYVEQWQECAKTGVQTWEPEREIRAPAAFVVGGEWHGGVRVIRQRTALCGKFGGECADHHAQCAAWRNGEVVSLESRKS